MGVGKEQMLGCLMTLMGLDGVGIILFWRLLSEILWDYQVMCEMIDPFSCDSFRVSSRVWVGNCEVCMRFFQGPHKIGSIDGTRGKLPNPILDRGNPPTVILDSFRFPQLRPYVRTHTWCILK